MALNLRHSIAPRILNSSIPTATLHSNARFSVRVTPPTPSTPSSNSAILTTFVWRSPASRVSLAGSFDDWRKHHMTYIPDINYHILVVELPRGEYHYRFVVDGRWKVAEDADLQEDEFGEMSHFLVIDEHVAERVQVKRFSTAFVAPSGNENEQQTGDVVVDNGDSDTEGEDEVVLENQYEEPLPRSRGADYVADYDEDPIGELDLQADVFEAIKDVAETTTPEPMQDSTSSTSYCERKQRRRKPPGAMLRRVWGMLFGEQIPSEMPDNREHRNTLTPTHNQRVHALANRTRGIKIWFPNEKNFPKREGAGRKVDPQESVQVIDVEEKALRLHQVEENANTRQMLGKTLFAQQKYDAALALFSLSVKLREDNGLKYAKTTAIAHTDVASAFIHLDDLKNADKHLQMALAIYKKNTFSGGRAQLGDVHCFLGVVGDMKGDLKLAEKAYRNAIAMYEEGKGVSGNPNYKTAKENLNANLHRQKFAPKQPAFIVKEDEEEEAGKLEPKKSEPKKSEGKKSEPKKSEGKKSEPRKSEPRKSEPRKSEPRKSEPRKSQPKPPPPPQPRTVKKPLQASRPAPRLDSEILTPSSTINIPPPPKTVKKERPTTWKDLADTARASMPPTPPEEDACSEEDDTGLGSYEEMCRQWHKDARKMMGRGEYKEAMDMYTLAIYTRKRHGPWSTKENAETLVEYARALFATKELDESVKQLKDAIEILEKMENETTPMLLGEVWGNLGSVMDRLGGHSQEALTAHCAGMVVYGRAGMSTDDGKWLKAWKCLCVNLKMSNSSERRDEIWHNIDLQIRGVAPLAKSSNVILHR